MNSSLILHVPGRYLPLRRLPAGGRPGTVERYSLAMLVAGVLLGLLGIGSALLMGATAP
ncbi:hypothetical protein SAMN04488038_10579 [Solimonas aquatica]|uniref:Uncharacterized protein n=1 Tax=Solimonas aquatica TaxID=489703 RepID=A0A1H9ELJ5_9GAMM|nr:hypothetical protein [Solimonas aquatica]SEQ26462.1 hypothetical protein SAMN04488038_10579 [Solimonas aquatica]